MEADEIRAIVAKWQVRLDLRAWEIEVDFDRGVNDGGSIMEVSRARAYLEARIALAPNWPDWTAEAVTVPEDDGDNMPPKTIDRIVAHELVHLLLHDLGNAHELIPFGALPTTAAQMLDDAVGVRLERATEEIARALCRAYGEG